MRHADRAEKQRSHFCTHTHTQKKVLTACVFESVDGVGQETDTAQKTRSLLFVDLLVVPDTDGDGICLSNVSDMGRNRVKENRSMRQKRGLRTMKRCLQFCHNASKFTRTK